MLKSLVYFKTEKKKKRVREKLQLHTDFAKKIRIAFSMSSKDTFWAYVLEWTGARPHKHETNFYKVSLEGKYNLNKPEQIFMWNSIVLKYFF